MTSHFKIIALAFLVTGCSVLQDKHDSLLIPPDVIGDTRLICSSETMTACDGFLTQKDIDKEK
jgi:hypothetical protein|tara:strand:- start:64 stop:252 length:189 start_codon:yes stop_codon:yes gene_type:complete